MSAEPKKAFNAIVDAYETWRDPSNGELRWERSRPSFMWWIGRARRSGARPAL